MANTTLTQFPAGQTQYKINFDYLARPFVVVTLINSSDYNLNKVLTVGNDYRFLNPTTIELLASQSGFDLVQISRSTTSELQVDFRDGSVLTASDLTTAELQAIHIAEEGKDQTINLGRMYAEAAGLSAQEAEHLLELMTELVTTSGWDSTLRSDLGVEGTTIVGGSVSAAGASHRALAEKLLDSVSILDFGGKDDYSGNYTEVSNATNNLNAFKKYVMFINLLGGTELTLKRTVGGTGKFYIEGDDTTIPVKPFRIMHDGSCSLHLSFSGGASNSPLVGVELTANHRLPVEYVNFGYTTYIASTIKKEMTDVLPTLNNSDGIYSIPRNISGSEFKVIRLSDINSEESPVTATTDSIVMNGSNTPVMAVVPAVIGDEVMALVGSPTSTVSGLVTIAGVVTADGVSYLGNNSADLSMIRYDSSGPVAGVPYMFMNQQRDLLGNSVVSVKVNSPRSYTVLVNGLAVMTHSVNSEILGVGFGCGNANSVVTVSQAVRISGKSYNGNKPLRIIVVGDSITDPSNQYSWSKYMVQMLGTAGITVGDVLNIAISGQTSGQQLEVLKTVGVGYDLCLIQIGVNDCQANVPYSAFSSNIAEMISYSKAIGAYPIVGVPTAYYSLAEANLHGQRGGQNTTNNESLHSYRAILIRQVAASGALLNLEGMKAYGAMTASWLDSIPHSVKDSIVVDNIHPTAYGSMMLAQGWARSVIGYYQQQGINNYTPSTTIPLSWTRGGFGATSRPSIKCGTFSGSLSVPSSGYTSGVVCIQLPPYVGAKAGSRTVPALGSDGLPIGSAQFFIGGDGKCYPFNVPASTAYIQLDGVEFN